MSARRHAARVAAALLAAVTLTVTGIPTGSLTGTSVPAPAAAAAATPQQRICDASQLFTRDDVVTIASHLLATGNVKVGDYPDVPLATVLRWNWGPAGTGPNINWRFLMSSMQWAEGLRILWQENGDRAALALYGRVWDSVRAATPAPTIQTIKKRTYWRIGALKPDRANPERLWTQQVYNDMAIGMRMSLLTCLAQTPAWKPTVSTGWAQAWRTAMTNRFGYSWLEHYYATPKSTAPGLNNHALFYDQGLVSLGVVLGVTRPCSPARDRVQRLWSRNWSADGANLEGAIGYHFRNIDWWAAADTVFTAAGCPVPSLAATLRQARDKAAYYVTPTGWQAQIGDTDAYQWTDQGAGVLGHADTLGLPTTATFGGYVSSRGSWTDAATSYALAHVGPGGEPHAHNDLGAVLWTINRYDVYGDAGRFDYGDTTDRDLAVSPGMHSLLQLPGEYRAANAGRLEGLRVTDTAATWQARLTTWVHNGQAWDWRRAVTHLPQQGCLVFTDWVNGQVSGQIASDLPGRSPLADTAAGVSVTRLGTDLDWTATGSTAVGTMPDGATVTIAATGDVTLTGDGYYRAMSLSPTQRTSPRLHVPLGGDGVVAMAACLNATPTVTVSRSGPTAVPTVTVTVDGATVTQQGLTATVS